MQAELQSCNNNIYNIHLCVNLCEIVISIDSMRSRTLKAIDLHIWLWRREQTEVWKLEKKTKSDNSNDIAATCRLWWTMVSFGNCSTY